MDHVIFLLIQMNAILTKFTFFCTTEKKNQQTPHN